MWFSSWLRSGASTHAPRPGVPRRPTPPFRPRLEALEDRTVPSTLTVTNNLDNGAGSLRDDVKAAKSGDTINFAPSLDGQTITLTSGELYIPKSLTIQGPGRDLLTISGDNLSRVFAVKDRQTVTLSGMTISNGNGNAGNNTLPGDDGAGGAIANLGALTLSDCTVSGNSASKGGGGIVNGFHLGGYQSTLTVIDCTISGNSAPYGGAIYNASGAMTISNSILSGNSAGIAGGAIYNDGGPTTVSGGCTLTGNSAGNYGGAIYNASGTLTVSVCTLTGNAASEGGAMYISGGAATVSTSSFCGNTPDDIFGPWTDGGGNTFC